MGAEVFTKSVILVHWIIPVIWYVEFVVMWSGEFEQVPDIHKKPAGDYDIKI